MLRLSPAWFKLLSIRVRTLASPACGLADCGLARSYSQLRYVFSNGSPVGEQHCLICVCNICAQHLWAASVGNICAQHLCATFPCNVSFQHLRASSVRQISVQHLRATSLCATSICSICVQHDLQDHPLCPHRKCPSLRFQPFNAPIQRPVGLPSVRCASM
jgi:hypothetical protein